MNQKKEQHVVLASQEMDCIERMTRRRSGQPPSVALAVILTLIQGRALATHGSKVSPTAIRIPDAQRERIFGWLCRGAMDMDAIDAANLALDYVNVMPGAYIEEEK